MDELHKAVAGLAAKMDVLQEQMVEQREEMKAQREEMKAQREEMKAQREETKAQREETKAQREEMKAQREEMRASFAKVHDTINGVGALVEQVDSHVKLVMEGHAALHEKIEGVDRKVDVVAEDVVFLKMRVSRIEARLPPRKRAARSRR
jgi:ribonuclease Y